MRPAARPRSRLQWHLAANAGVLFWLTTLVAVAVGHRFVPESRWLLVHLLLLGAVTNAILVWSAHFAHALLKNPPASRRGEAIRLVALNAGVVAVVAGIVTTMWPLTLAGAVIVGGAVAAHGISLAHQARTALPSRFGASVRYYVAASVALPVGATLGTLLARHPEADVHGRLVVAHVAANVLGWVGLTVLGTLLTLWPTILRTRMAEGAERQSRQALPALLVSLAAVVVAALFGALLVTALAVLGYLGAALWSLRPMLAAARSRAPQSYAAWSVLAATGWLVVSLGWLAGLLATAPDWVAAGEAAHRVAVPLAGGFAAQVLLGALTYLLPVVRGGGPAAVRAAAEVLERGSAARVVTANLGLALLLLPSPSLVRVLVSLLVLAAYASFLILLPLALRRRRTGGEPGDRSRVRHVPEPSAQVRSRHTGLAAAGLSAIVLAVAVGAALDPAALGPAAAASAGVAASGRTTTVKVEARAMRFHPASVDVPAGNRLVIEVVNRDSDVHDLALETGQHSGRLSSGQSGRVEVELVGRSLEGWCTIVGHRQMGMLFSVRRDRGRRPEWRRATAPVRTRAMVVRRPRRRSRAIPDFMARPAAGFTARDPRLAPAPTGEVHRVSLSAREVEREVAVGVRQRLWTFNGTAPGPVLRGRVGDRFEVTLRNDAGMGHSIDFHAGSLAPDQPMRTLAPGESLTYTLHSAAVGRLDVPLQLDADVAAHRQRHVRGRGHRPAGPAHGGPRVPPGPVGALPRAPGRHGRPGEGGRREAGCRGVQRFREPVRPRPARGARRRAGAALGAGRRSQPAQLVPRRGWPVRHRLQRGCLPAQTGLSRQGGRRPGARRCSRPRVVSSSCPSRKPGTTPSSHTSWLMPSVARTAYCGSRARSPHDRPAVPRTDHPGPARRGRGAADRGAEGAHADRCRPGRGACRCCGPVARGLPLVEHHGTRAADRRHRQ